MELVPEHLSLLKILKNCYYLKPPWKTRFIDNPGLFCSLDILVIQMVNLRVHSRNGWQAHKLGDSVSWARLSLKLKNKVGIAWSGLENHDKNTFPQSFEPSPLSLPKSVPTMTNFLHNLEAAILTTSGKMLIRFIFKWSLWNERNGLMNKIEMCHISKVKDKLISLIYLWKNSSLPQ